MGRRQRSRGRDVHGVLVFDKPEGLPSRQAVNRVNDIVHAKKIGHTGSLDPLATGVLPLVLGNATKFSQYLLNADKEYKVKVLLGVSTDSGDADGQVIAERCTESLSREKIEKALSAYRGKIWQTPPMFSALKHQGQPLYKLARKGIEVERNAREQIIFKNELVDFEGTELHLDLHCSKGTYVRTLVHDLGEDLGCGAHVIALRRTKAGPFGSDQLVTLEQLQDAQANKSIDKLLMPVESTISHWPAVEVNKVAAFHVRQGQTIAVAHSLEKGWVGLFEENSSEPQSRQFIGVGEVLEDGTIAPKRLIT
ncbi:MAG: tRNA pseudouridine(55) synthase TruB [Gammaproteobacteria bacterium]|nr:tRNA pseudouridine(55) synthase TruB [Gammaproteobacteria bacterium]